MQQQNKAILQTCRAQFQNAKATIYADAFNQKVAELHIEFEKYKSQEQMALNKAIEELKQAYERAVQEKSQAFDAKISAVEQQIQAKAKAFADAQVAETDKLIAQMDALIGKE